MAAKQSQIDAIHVNLRDSSAACGKERSRLDAFRQHVKAIQERQHKISNLKRATDEEQTRLGQMGRVAIGLGLTVLCILLAGMLRRPFAYYLGWGIQVVAIGLGFVIPVMFGLGAIFLALWWAAYAVGRKIDREKAEAAAAAEQQ